MHRSLFTLTLATTTALAQPGFAELTGKDVWSDMRGYLESFGYEVQSIMGATRGSDAVLSHFKLIFPMPDEAGSVTIDMGPTSFLTTDEGVSVTFSDVIPIAFDITEDGETVSGAIEYRNEGLNVLVSGAPGDLTYDYSATSLDMELTDMQVDGESIGRDVARFDIVLNDVSGQAEVDVGDLREIAQSVAFSALSYDVFFKDPDNDATLIQIVGETSDLASTTNASLPLEMDPEDMSAMMAAGLKVAMDLTYGAGSLDMNITEDGETVAVQFGSEGGEGAFGMDANALAYDLTYTGVTIQASGADIPFPVALEAEDYGMGFAMPLAKTGEAGDFGLKFTLGNFEMNDMIWNMFDPGKALPRDPATLVVDLAGKAKMLFDIFDPAEAAAMENADMPAELETLDIKEILLSAVGAEMKGSGAFKFDNSDLETFDGFPRPEGSLSVDIQGVNALMDKLVQMGLIGDEEVMGARMMMAMVAKQVGEDALESVIEINSEGHLLANGMRLQ